MTTGFAAALGTWRDRRGPLARTLAAAVREAVVDGRLPAGTRLPSERELARVLDISRGTVVAALALLRDDGWLHTRHGSGSLVRLPARLTERTTPWSLDRGGAGDADLDLTLAVTAAPHEAYLAALARAAERSAALLVDSGIATAGLPRLRELLADRYLTRASPPAPNRSSSPPAPRPPSPCSSTTSTPTADAPSRWRARPTRAPWRSCAPARPASSPSP